MLDKLFSWIKVPIVFVLGSLSFGFQKVSSSLTGICLSEVDGDI